MGNQDIVDRCGACTAWRPPTSGTAVKKGECRANPPLANGWPQTAFDGWCRSGFIRKANSGAPEMAAVEMGGPNTVMIDFGYVEVYPELAAQWLAAAQKTCDVPAAIADMIRDPLRQPMSNGLPLDAESTDALCGWCERFPGCDNGDDSNDGWRGILTQVRLPDMRPCDVDVFEKSELARRRLISWNAAEGPVFRQPSQPAQDCR